MFDLSIGKLLVLAVIAIVVFGPDQLPKLAAQAGRTLRELRRMAEGATADLREGLGPEFSDFDVTDLHAQFRAQAPARWFRRRGDAHVPGGGRGGRGHR